MGGSFINGIQTGNSIYLLQDSIFEEDNRYRANFNWRRRDPISAFQPNPWTHLWARSGFCAGDMTTPWGLLGDDGSEICGWGPWEPLGRGNQSVKFIIGTCVDSVDVPIANPVVQAFRTSDDRIMGEVIGNTDGTYAVPTDSPVGTPHYIVAYKGGAPDIAGTTVNTLTPTNIDGS